MKLRVALLIGLSILASGVAAEIGFATRAYVVSVDVTAKSIRLRHRNVTTNEWTESVATWDDQTVWSTEPIHVWDSKPATAAVVKTLKKDDKVYVGISDRGEKTKQLWLTELSTLPPGEKVE